MERVVPLCGQLTDGPFGKIIVYRKLPVVQVSEELLPKFPQEIKRFPVVPTPELQVLANTLSNQLRILITISFTVKLCLSRKRTSWVNPASVYPRSFAKISLISSKNTTFTSCL